MLAHSPVINGGAEGAMRISYSPAMGIGKSGVIAL